VRHAGFFLFALLLTAPFAGAAETLDFPTPLVAQVFATAYGFMAPRTLEAIPIPRLALWALRGLAVMDPALMPERQADQVVLRGADRELLRRPAPGPDDADGWGMVTAELAAAGWGASATVRRAGPQGVIRGLFDELFNHLDPYSRYAAPGETEIDRQGRRADGGVGLILGQRGARVVIDAVQPDSPAAAAGLRPGETLLAIDRTPLGIADAVSTAALLAGPPATHVRLELRGHDGRRLRVDLLRGLVPPQSVFASPLDGLLILRLTGFQRGTGQQFDAALKAANARHIPPRGLVLDLRGNRGGLLQQAVAVVGGLLGSGLVAITAGRDPSANRVLQADAEARADDLPVVVLVDGRSASAAEITAAALADNRRAVVIGSATLGKGLIQTVTPLPDGGELFVTWSRVLAPLGWPIQDLGVLPQICTSLGADTLQQELETLAKGDRPLAAALARHRTARPPLPATMVLEIRDACPAAIGTDLDLQGARFLIDHPDSYANALLPPQFLPAAP